MTEQTVREFIKKAIVRWSIQSIEPPNALDDVATVILQAVREEVKEVKPSVRNLPLMTDEEVHECEVVLDKYESLLLEALS